MIKHAVQKIKVSPGTAGLRLDRWLKQHCALENPNIVQKWIRTGQVRIDSKRAKPQTILEEGQEVRLPPFYSETLSPAFQKRIDSQWIEKIQQAILYQDAHILVINKPTGLASQGGSGTKISLDEIVQALPLEGAENFKLTHRLDKDTSGIMVFAKSSRDSAWVTAQFKERLVQKTYWALVVGKPAKSQGVIDLPIAKLPGKQGEKMAVDLEHGLEACTYYKVKATHQGISWVEFKPETGRTHQIRVHSLTLGCPILGDGKYGGKAAHPFGQRLNIHLHARSLILTLPSLERKSFEAPLPFEMKATCQRLGFDDLI